MIEALNALITQYNVDLGLRSDKQIQLVDDLIKAIDAEIASNEDGDGVSHLEKAIFYLRSTVDAWGSIILIVRASVIKYMGGISNEILPLIDTNAVKAYTYTHQKLALGIIEKEMRLSGGGFYSIALSGVPRGLLEYLRDKNIVDFDGKGNYTASLIGLMDLKN
jgi:hypothetical protein